MPSGANIVVLGGLVIGLAYGAVGLLSGFCLVSGLRGWWAQGDGRLIRTFALALGVAIIASQLLAGAGVVDLGKSIYLQPTFSAPLMFFGGVLFGYGMVLSNGCGARALVLLGRGNLRSLVVVIVLGIVAEMTLKGLIAPGRIAALQSTQITANVTSLPALLSRVGISEVLGRTLAAPIIGAALIIFAFAHAPFQRAWGQIAAGVIIGLLIAAGWYVTGYLGADDFNPVPVTSLTFVAPIADTLQYMMLSTGLTLNFGIATVGRRVRRKPGDGAGDPAFSLGRLYFAAPYAALDQRRGADGRGRRDGVGLLDRAGPDRTVDAGAVVVRGRRRNSIGRRRRPARRAACSAAGLGLTTHAALGSARDFEKRLRCARCSRQSAGRVTM